MRVSHLCEADPGQPGMSTRTGPPWMFGNDSPFICQTIMLSASSALAMRTPRDSVGLLASPDR
jgi:hypothetical protein